MLYSKEDQSIIGVEIVNLTPHPVNLHILFEKEDSIIEVKPSGEVVRVAEESEKGDLITLSDDISVHFYSRKFGDVEGLPPKEEGKIYLVSSLVLERLGPERDDCYTPYPLIRDEKGRVIGASGLTRSSRVARPGNFDMAYDTLKRYVEDGKTPIEYLVGQLILVLSHAQDIALGNYNDFQVTMHNQNLDIARLQGCHVKDEDYKS